ncbi:hypothetical protein FJY84_06985 [Candidatus Bathyarchaeota archaeon]|nr:hypothetical protein [Candidatus Bathyarchaeota archaeon]
MSLLKDLGSLQLKILEFLAENPNNHRQGIQQKIGYPAEQYASINNAVIALEKMGYIESKEGLSEKKVKIKLYSCTDTGVFYILSRNKFINPTVLTIINAYSNKYQIINFYKELYEKDSKFFSNFYNILVSSLPFFQKGKDEGIYQLLLILSINNEKLDWIVFLKSYFEYFPESKNTLINLRNLLDQLIT